MILTEEWLCIILFVGKDLHFLAYDQKHICSFLYTKHKRHVNSWLLILEKHGALKANVHKTSFTIVHSVIVCCVSGNPVSQDHWHTWAYLNNQLRYICFQCLLCTNQHTKEYRKRKRVKGKVFPLLGFPMELVNADIITSIPFLTEVTLLIGCM